MSDEGYTLDEARVEIARRECAAHDQWGRHGETSREWRAVDRLLDRYRECADYGLTLQAEHDGAGDP